MAALVLYLSHQMADRSRYFSVCGRYTVQVSADLLLAFTGFIQSLQANSGILPSNSGYTQKNGAVSKVNK
jgi:hypothetical protein